MKPCKSILTVAVLSVLVLLTACAAADYDIRGTWDYVMTDTNQNTYDEGTITFEGSPTKGTYLQINIYDVDYEGEYTVQGTTLVLTGDESWNGEMADADHISGTWQHEGEGNSGTFEAVRLP